MKSFLGWVMCMSLFAAGCSNADEGGEAAEPVTTSIFPVEQVSSYIRCMLEDRRGNLWMGTTQDGVVRYDGKELTYFAKGQGLAGVCVKDIVEDAQGNLWFATEGGVSRYDGMAFTTYTGQDGLDDNDTWSILKTKDGTMWVGTTKGLNRYQGGRFVHVGLPVSDVVTEGGRLPPTAVTCMAEDAGGNIWVGLGGAGLRKYDGNKFTVYNTANGLAGNNIWCVMLDRNGHLWFGTRGGGVSRYDGRSFVNFTQKEGLSGNNVSALCEDRKGNIWIGTSGEGVSVYNGKEFITYKDETGITQNHVQSICDDRSGITWVGFSGGLFRFNGKKLINVSKSGPWQ